jgi:hypothetical protein
MIFDNIIKRDSYGVTLMSSREKEKRPISGFERKQNLELVCFLGFMAMCAGTYIASLGVGHRALVPVLTAGLIMVVVGLGAFVISGVKLLRR